MKEPIIESLFPIPIYRNNIDRLFTKQELNFVKEQKNTPEKIPGVFLIKFNQLDYAAETSVASGPLRPSPISNWTF